jgi:hypothetical protein
MLRGPGVAGDASEESVVAAVRAVGVAFAEQLIEPVAGLLAPAVGDLHTDGSKSRGGHRDEQRRLALTARSEIAEPGVYELSPGKVVRHRVHTSILGGEPPAHGLNHPSTHKHSGFDRDRGHAVVDRFKLSGGSSDTQASAEKVTEVPEVEGAGADGIDRATDTGYVAIHGRVVEGFAMPTPVRTGGEFGSGTFLGTDRKHRGQ